MGSSAHTEEEGGDRFVFPLCYGFSPPRREQRGMNRASLRGVSQSSLHSLWSRECSALIPLFHKAYMGQALHPTRGIPPPSHLPLGEWRGHWTRTTLCVWEQRGA